MTASSESSDRAIAARVWRDRPRPSPWPPAPPPRSGERRDRVGVGVRTPRAAPGHRLQQLVAGGQHRQTRAPDAADRGDPHRREHSELRRRSERRLSTVAPGSMSSPVCRTLVPGLTSASISTRPSRTLVSSIRTTESAPSGITAPVEILIASPPCNADRAGRPAWDSSATVRVTDPRRRAASVRRPHREAVHRGVVEAGNGSALSTSTARIRPSASRRGTGSAPNEPTRSRTRRLASSRSIGLSAGARVRASPLDSQHHVARLDHGGHILARLYSELANRLDRHRRDQPHTAHSSSTFAIASPALMFVTLPGSLFRALICKGSSSGL